MRAHSILFAFAFQILGCIAHGQLPAPELLALGRIGGQIGQPVSPLENASGPLTAGSQLFFRGHEAITVLDAGELPGICSVRAKNDYGLSNARGFLVTREPWTVATNNESPDKAIELTANHFYQDECPERGFNYYRIRFEHDQLVRIHTFARRLDSRARLSLMLRSGLQPDANTSRPIKSATSPIDRDVALNAQLRANTDYLISVSDHLYRGGPEYRYALQIELVNETSNEESQRGCTIWKNISEYLLSPEATDRSLGLQLPFLHPRSSLLRRPIVGTEPIVHVEKGRDETATQVAFPALVDGSFEPNGDVDMFDLELEKDADAVLEVLSQRIGELTDPMITVDRIENRGQPNEKKTRIGENDDMPAIGNGEMRFLVKDSILSFRAPERGVYRISLRNLQRLESDARTARYAMEIRSPKPGFVLATHWSYPIRDQDQSKPSSMTISTGGSLLLTTHIYRFDGFSGAVDLFVDGLPAATLGGKAVIAADQIATTLTLWHDPTKTVSSQSADSASPSIAKLRIRGVHQVADGTEIRCEAVPTEVVYAQLDTFRAPLSRCSDGMFLARATKQLSPLSVQLDKPADTNQPPVLEAKRGTPLKIPIAVTRRAGGESSVITVRLRQTPTKITAGEVRIEAKANEGTLELQVPKDAPLGEYVLNTLCEAAISYPNPDPAAKDKNITATIQLPSSSVRIKIGDAP